MDNSKAGWLQNPFHFTQRGIHVNKMFKASQTRDNIKKFVWKADSFCRADTEVRARRSSPCLHDCFFADIDPVGMVGLLSKREEIAVAACHIEEFLRCAAVCISPDGVEDELNE